MGFLSSIAGFLAKPIVGTIGSIATGLYNVVPMVVFLLVILVVQF